MKTTLEQLNLFAGLLVSLTHYINDGAQSISSQVTLTAIRSASTLLAEDKTDRAIEVLKNRLEWLKS